MIIRISSPTETICCIELIRMENTLSVLNNIILTEDELKEFTLSSRASKMDKSRERITEFLNELEAQGVNHPNVTPKLGGKILSIRLMNGSRVFRINDQYSCKIAAENFGTFIEAVRKELQAGNLDKFITETGSAMHSTKGGHSTRAVKIQRRCTKNGKVRTFKSITEAVRETGLNYPTVRALINGTRKQSRFDWSTSA